MSDESAAATNQINEHLLQRNEELEEELRKMRALLERPVTVNIQAPEQATLKKIGEYLPQLTHLSTNVAEVGGKLVQANKLSETTNTLLRRIAEALEAQVPKEEA